MIQVLHHIAAKTHLFSRQCSPINRTKRRRFSGKKKEINSWGYQPHFRKNLRCSVLTLKLAQDKIHRIGVHNLSSELDHERQAGILDTNNLVIWDLRNPHHNLRFETDLKEQAMAATKSNLPSTQQHRSPSCVYAQTIQG